LSHTPRDETWCAASQLAQAAGSANRTVPSPPSASFAFGAALPFAELATFAFGAAALARLACLDFAGLASRGFA
jgi:hypothetical protein